MERDKSWVIKNNVKPIIKWNAEAEQILLH